MRQGKRHLRYRTPGQLKLSRAVQLIFALIFQYVPVSHGPFARERQDTRNFCFASVPGLLAWPALERMVSHNWTLSRDYASIGPSQRRMSALVGTKIRRTVGPAPKIQFPQSLQRDLGRPVLP
jgi:hypothetical protein